MLDSRTETRFLAEDIAALVEQSPPRRHSCPLAGEAAFARQWRAFQRRADMLGPPPLDTSIEARMRRRIQFLADRYRWQIAIDTFLDDRGVASMEQLAEPQLADLLSRMEGHLDAAMHGCDMPDDLPVR